MTEGCLHDGERLRTKRSGRRLMLVLSKSDTAERSGGRSERAAGEDEPCCFPPIGEAAPDQYQRFSPSGRFLKRFIDHMYWSGYCRT